MVAGTLTVQGEGGEPAKLAAGGFASEPANVAHTTRCEEGADCVFLVKQKFDFKKATAPEGSGEVGRRLFTQSDLNSRAMVTAGGGPAGASRP